MAMQILFLRGNTAQNDAYTGPLGSITLDTQARRIRLHNGTTVGGFAQLVNLEDLDALQIQINNLGIADIAGLQAALTALENADIALDGRITTIEAAYINKDGSVAFTGNQSMGGFLLTNVATPIANTDAATKGYVDTEITAIQDAVDALGAAFNYVGTLAGGATEPTAFDLDTLAVGGKDAGDYYKVTTAGWFVVGLGTPFYANVGDGIVWNTTAGVDKIDNTNSEVQGTTNFIDVAGNTDTGFTVDVDAAFKTRVTTAETEITATQAGAGLSVDGDHIATIAATYISTATSLDNADNLLDAALNALAITVGNLGAGTVTSVSGTAPIVVDNTDPSTPVISANLVTTTTDGTMSSTDKVKLNGIAAGAQVNTVDSVNGQTGVVVVTKADVGLGDVENYAIATQAEVEAAVATTVNNKYMTPLRTRQFVEGGTYTIDLGTL